MRKLFPIELRGAETCEVESMASYVHRIAFEHGLYVGELLRYVYRIAVPHMKSGAPLPAMPGYLKVHELVRPNQITKMYVQLLELMSSQSLRSSTLWFMDSAIGRSRGEVVEGFRWCPECFEEMEQLDQEPYFKLIWHLNGIVACPRHRTPLISQCEFCHCDQVTYRKQFPLGICQRCGEKLSIRRKRLRPEDVQYTWEAEGGDVLQLFGDLAELNENELPHDGVMTSLSQLFDYYWSQDREEELYRLLSRDQFLALLHRQTPISLKVARRIAYRLGLSLYTLMSGNARYSSAILNSSWVCELPPSLIKPVEKPHHDHQVIIRKLRRIVRSAVRPPSVRQLAKELGVSVGYLEYRFPAAVKDVVKKHEQFVAQERSQRRLSAQKAAISFFVDEQYRDRPKSRKEAYRVLRQETGLPKFVLMRAIQNAYDVLR